MTHGKGPKLYDVDGAEYSDFHGGYGVSVVGHAHPEDRRRGERAGQQNGTHFAQPTEDAIIVAENLRERFGQPLWRFGNSGTEATMDAVHLMRAFTGRDLILKVEGCYHGHHDSVEVSVYPDAERRYRSRRRSDRHRRQHRHPERDHRPRCRRAVQRPRRGGACARRRTQVRSPGMIVEPIMMNAGIIHPEPGYLAGLKELLHKYDALLTFDEIKTGLTAGPAGATGMYGVVPDLTCLAKAVGGGISIAAIGGREDVMELIADGTYQQVGTFNGNPLAMASAKATLTEILDDAAYEHLYALRDRMRDGIEAVIAEYDLPWHVTTAGAKGASPSCPSRPRTSASSSRSTAGTARRTG